MPDPIKVVGIFKLTKGFLLLCVAIGAFALLGRDLAAILQRLVLQLHADPDHRFIRWLLVRIGIVDAVKLKEFGIVSLLYSCILLTEGFGLMWKKHWAEYMTLIATAFFIPLEVFEIIRRVTGIRIILLLVNVAIVLYLASVVSNLWRKHRLEARHPAGRAQ
jgi:uncharacterized membrane protein (DUF2068 family)